MVCIENKFLVDQKFLKLIYAPSPKCPLITSSEIFTTGIWDYETEIRASRLRIFLSLVQAFLATLWRVEIQVIRIRRCTHLLNELHRTSSSSCSNVWPHRTFAGDDILSSQISISESISHDCSPRQWPNFPDLVLSRRLTHSTRHIPFHSLVAFMFFDECLILDGTARVPLAPYSTNWRVPLSGVRIIQSLLIEHDHFISKGRRNNVLSSKREIHYRLLGLC